MWDHQGVKRKSPARGIDSPVAVVLATSFAFGVAAAPVPSVAKWPCG